MTLDTDRLRTAVGPNTVESISKLVLGVAWLAFVLALASLIPGLDLLRPRTPVTLAAVLGALAALAVVGLLLYLASGLAAMTRLVLDGPAEVVEHVASIVHWLVVLAAVLVAHAGLGPAVAPLVGEVRWLYGLPFLLLALGPLGVVAVRCYIVLDPLAALVAERVNDAAQQVDGDESDETDDTAVDAPNWTSDGDQPSS